MKTATQFFALMMALILISTAGNVMAQGRGHHRGENHDRRHDHERIDHEDHDDERERKHHWEHDKHRGQNFHHRRGHHHHDRPQVRHVVHHHDRHCDHRHAASGYHQRPRYIHYPDYDVYYDLHREVYITWSGRNWTASSSLPVVLHRVNTRRTVRMEVDYVDDDFPTYLQTRRPAYRRVYMDY